MQVFLTWEQFKKEIEKTSESKKNIDLIYRGHASSKWKLETTLHRFLYNKNDYVLAKKYNSVLHNVLSDSRVTAPREFENLKLPTRSPFINGLLFGNEEHYQDFINTFNLMIKLRHLGFPTPILDWTKTLNVALFFALSGGKINDPISIFQLERTPNNYLPPFELNIFCSEFHFSSENSRHEKQNAIYTLAIHQEHIDTLLPVDKRCGPKFYIGSYEELTSQQHTLKKYTITDSPEMQLSILEELYTDGVSFESIYGQTHALENTLLKDLAIKTLLFDKLITNTVDTQP